MRKIILAILFAITLSMAFSYQDAAAMTVLYADPIDGVPFDVPWTETNIFADDFVLTSPETVTDIHFFAAFFSGNPFDGNVIYAIYTDDAGQPGLIMDSGLLVNVGTQPDGLGVGCTICFFVWGDLPFPFPLAAGTYWVGLQGTTPASSLVLDDTPVGASLQFSDDGGETWNPASGLGIPLEITGPDQVIGGIFVPIDQSALLLAGVQSVSMWMIPVVIAGIGIGVFVIKRRN